MLTLLQQVPLERVLLLIFLAGRLLEQFKNTRASLRDQGRRIGDVETRVAALEASRNRG